MVSLAQERLCRASRHVCVGSFQSLSCSHNENISPQCLTLACFSVAENHLVPYLWQINNCLLPSLQWPFKSQEAANISHFSFNFILSSLNGPLFLCPFLIQVNCPDSFCLCPLQPASASHLNSTLDAYRGLTGMPISHK